MPFYRNYMLLPSVFIILNAIERGTPIPTTQQVVCLLRLSFARTIICTFIYFIYFMEQNILLFLASPFYIV